VPAFVFVPGLFGSDLAVTKAVNVPFAGIKVWYDPIRIAIGSWNWMGLAADGVQPGPGFPFPLEAGGPTLAYHAPILNWFMSRGWTIYTPMLDWRKVFSSDGQRLVDVLTSLPPDQLPVSILCHSRGGLVVRSALQILGTAWPMYVKSVAALGTPHYGSMGTVTFLAGWSLIAQNTIDVIVGLPSLVSGASAFGLFQQIVATWPSIYYLFPSPLSFWMDPAVISTLYAPLPWPPVNFYTSPEWLSAAFQNWSALPLPPAGLPWLDVVGSGFPTAISCNTPVVPRSAGDIEFTNGGDGVVVLQSSTLPGNQRVTSYTAHQALVHDYRLFPYYEQWLQGELAGDVTVPGGPVT
jgi:hypothetical protein